MSNNDTSRNLDEVLKRIASSLDELKTEIKNLSENFKTMPRPSSREPYERKTAQDYLDDYRKAKREAYWAKREANAQVRETSAAHDSQRDAFSGPWQAINSLIGTIGPNIAKLVTSAIKQTSENLEQVLEDLTDVFDWTFDFDDNCIQFKHKYAYYKPRRWRYGEHQQQSKEDAILPYLNETAVLILTELQKKPQGLQELKNLFSNIESDLIESEIDNLKNVGAVIQETNGLYRFIITQKGVKALDAAKK
jgi:predicted transcriptional regulator